MPEINWKEAYFKQQSDLAEKLDCVSHPNNINEALRDLQRRAAGGDRKRARRHARLKTAMTKALRSEGCTADEMKGVDEALDRIAKRLVSP